MALLRDFHGRMEEEVFRHGGCLEKFIGDALLATFGVPDTGTRDATDALACARGMLAALSAWNREREAAGLRPLQIGLGLHYGPVVAGDIGSRRSMAFATVGDTTNVTSRLQALTRELRVSIVASAALVAAVECEAGATRRSSCGRSSRGPYAPQARARSAGNTRVARSSMVRSTFACSMPGHWILKMKELTPSRSA
jgi:class 3 adenylate cyclase